MLVMNRIYDMDLNLLKSLQALIQEQHVGRAADRLNVTQPAMSHALRRLRGQFNDPLLVRSGNAMVLTPRAVDLGQRLDMVFAELSTLTRSKEFSPKDLNGGFRIDTHDFVASEYLAPGLRNACQQAPGLSLNLHSFTPQSYEALETGKSDLVVGAGLRASPRFMQRVVAEDPLICLLDAGHPALDIWTAETIYRYPHITLEMLDKQNDPVEVFGRTQGLPTRRVGLTTGSLHMQPSLLPGTEMIAFLPKSLADRAAQAGELVALPCAFALPGIKIRMIWSERNQKDPGHQWLRSLLIG